MKPSQTEKPLLIGLDLGTTAIKGVLTNAAGRILDEATVNNQILQPCEGWAEVDPVVHYQHVCDVIRRLADHAPGAVVALSMAAASGNTLLTDDEGKPLTPILNWMDNRAETSPPKRLEHLTSEEVARITGWPCLDSFPLAHLAWLRENDAACFAGAAHYGMDTDWLLYRLTGFWRMDHSSAATFHLVDQMTGTYHKPFLQMLGIPESKLSSLISSGSIVGPLTEQAACDTGLTTETMVVAGSFDHPAAARAAGVMEPGELMLSCGTSWVGFLPHGDRNDILDAGLLCDPFLSAEGGPWAGMFSVPRIGRSIDWYINNVIAVDEPDPIAVFNHAAGQGEPGAGGLTIDLREPPSELNSSREHISRAVMEGAAHLVNEKILDLKHRGLSFSRAVMVGGPSRSPIWPDIVAEITGLEISIAGRSSGACGAAILAMNGIGLYTGGSSVGVCAG